MDSDFGLCCFVIYSISWCLMHHGSEWDISPKDCDFGLCALFLVCLISTGPLQLIILKCNCICSDFRLMSGILKKMTHWRYWGCWLYWVSVGSVIRRLWWVVLCDNFPPAFRRIYCDNSVSFLSLMSRRAKAVSVFSALSYLKRFRPIFVLWQFFCFLVAPFRHCRELGRKSESAGLRYSFTAAVGFYEILHFFNAFALKFFMRTILLKSIR